MTLNNRTYGFNSLNLDSLVESAFATLCEKSPISAHPYYNVVKTGEYTFSLEFAVAGFDRKDLSVRTEDGRLIVKGEIEPASNVPVMNYIHKGISTKSFNRVFKLAENVEIKEVVYLNGILTVNLIVNIPETKKPKHFEIV